MQKLTGISSGQNNKSCRIIHHESNKIGRAFFCFFYDFLRNLQETGKSLLLFQLRFCSRDPGKKIFFAMWSWRGWPARVGQIPVRFAGVWLGKGRGMARGSPRVDLSQSWGWGGQWRLGRRRGAGGCRSGYRSGEDAVLAGQSGVREAMVEGHGGACVHEWQSGGAEGGTRRERPWRRGCSLLCSPARRVQACRGSATLGRRQERRAFTPPGHLLRRYHGSR
jgi:hypothetical protein